MCFAECLLVLNAGAHPHIDTFIAHLVLACLLPCQVFTLTHMLTHTVVLAAAYRTAGQLGVRRALLAGMMLIVSAPLLL